MDDTFFNIIFENHKSCLELLLRIVLEKPDLVVKEVIVQKNIPNIYGREVRFDVFAIDGDGNYYNVEVQRSNVGADPRRPRYNSAMLDTLAAEKGMKWQELAKTKVIMITERDVLAGGLSIYHIKRKIEEMNNKDFGDGTEIIYVNGAAKADDALGWLIHDLNCTDPKDMHYKELAEATAFYKEEQKGVNAMCEIMEELRDELIEELGDELVEKGRAEGRAEIAFKMLKDNFSLDEVARLTDLPFSKVQELARTI